jgi:hypothetical protein
MSDNTPGVGRVARVLNAVGPVVGVGRSQRQNEATLDALANLGKPPQPVAYRPPKRPVRDLLTKWMRARKWNYRTPRQGVRRRLYDLVSSRTRWWDWGHPIMVITGTDEGGNWAAPSPPTWWYRLGQPTRMARTKYPRHPLSTFQVVTDYEEFRRLTDGLDEDGMYEWNAIHVGESGTLSLGKRYWGGTFYGMSKWETALLRRYLRMWRRHDWFGARSWLYSQGLHAAVYQRKPFTCQAAPPKKSGGYSHWLCEEKRRHDGDHRYRSYTWPGGTAPVVHNPRSVP